MANVNSLNNSKSEFNALNKKARSNCHDIYKKQVK